MSKRALGLELSASLNLGCKLRDKKEAFSSRINYHKCSHSHGQNHITCNKLAIPGNYFNVPIALDLKKKKKKFDISKIPSYVPSIPHSILVRALVSCVHALCPVAPSTPILVPMLLTCFFPSLFSTLVFHCHFYMLSFPVFLIVL